MVRRLNVLAMGRGDLAGHGGEQRAVFVLSTRSYRYWQQQLHRADFAFGQFGENFTIDGLPDTDVCIGDRYRVAAHCSKSPNPESPVYRVGIRMDEPRMAALLVSHGRPGFYFRVLQEGEVEAGNEIFKVLEGPERMSVAEINQLLLALPRPSASKLERALRTSPRSAPVGGNLSKRFSNRTQKPGEWQRRLNIGQRTTSSLAGVPSFVRLANCVGVRQCIFAGAHLN